ncbi:hypothetical protein ASPVEDRAFT_89278 [Aspergillus versicolor CBS 583.65]|uniref:Uncharacterized protein n=1 Tax=Aspergillus versicolor CBS 583.65 TaxID=1036611 RepID=A0A1L9Q2S7_ASPVE|nr:uncharacterized protein ASPVEDRAFT_89278 [Aspergillus versicolor CBS 583.65]OJJ08046.1 hypothetical protein ASPVEDRAFT_89278 [Aspergillus versicolor CBS 583.65]
MSYGVTSSKRGGAWTKVMIFVSLYVLLLESLIEWAVVLYLYGNKSVDSKMAPSLIFSLVASFLTVPLVVLHSFLAWQYNKVAGYISQKATLHTACTYVLRLTTLIWLGSSVAGLVVVSQQAYCLPDSAGGSFWKVGVSCALHRAVVIVSVLSFITVCLYFCSRELCQRPYDVSLLGVYRHQHSRSRDGSVLSGSTLQSEKSLKRDILCVCRHHDITYGRAPYIPPSDHSGESGSIPSIQQPMPIRPTSFLSGLGPDSDSEAGYLTGTTATSGTLSDSFQNSVSRTSSTATAQTNLQAHNQILSELPAATLQQHSNHTKNQSSVSSLRRFLPKSLPISVPLSSDPQIRALAEANAQVDLEKQEPQSNESAAEKSEPSASPAKPPQQPEKDEQPTTQSPQNTQPSTSTTSLPRSTTSNSAEAPEVVTPAPLKIRRSHTTQTVPLPLNSNPVPYNWANLPDHTPPKPLRINTMHNPRRQGHFDPHHMPRYTQSQRFPPGRNFYSRRNQSKVPGVAYQHPGPRRPRSTIGNVSIASVSGHLDCIRETGASIDELPPDNRRIPGGRRQGY